MGLNRRERDGLLEILYDHMVQQKYVVRYRWKPGDLGIWDNRAAVRFVVFDSGDQHRLTQRVTLRGDRP